MAEDRQVCPGWASTYPNRSLSLLRQTVAVNEAYDTEEVDPEHRLRDGFALKSFAVDVLAKLKGVPWEGCQKDDWFPLPTSQ